MFFLLEMVSVIKVSESDLMEEWDESRNIWIWFRYNLEDVAMKALLK